MTDKRLKRIRACHYTEYFSSETLLCTPCPESSGTSQPFGETQCRTCGQIWAEGRGSLDSDVAALANHIAFKLCEDPQAAYQKEVDDQDTLIKDQEKDGDVEDKEDEEDQP